MPWIAVHEEVLGSKLRGLRKRLDCSDVEALGILTVVWLWGRKNADINGLLPNTDKRDIGSAISPYLGDNMRPIEVVEALIAEEWLEEDGDAIYIHDWYEWQQYWYNYLEKKEKDKNRKRAEREKAKKVVPEVPKKTESEPEEKQPEKPKKAEEKKVKYAESVSMKVSEHDKLISTYGLAFTAKLVEELDNYKMANGRKYKDDYRAILNWVVEKCEKKYPNLKKKEVPKTDEGFNPFSQYM